MPTSAIQQRLEDMREVPPAKPVGEAVWQAWVFKGRAREERGSVMYGHGASDHAVGIAALKAPSF